MYKDKFIVKVVSTLVNHKYVGVKVTSNSASAERMKMLFNPASVDSEKSNSSVKNTQSKVLWEINDYDNTEHGGAISFCAENVLDTFASMDDPAIRQARSEFFSSVESGKRELADKFGSKIPAEEIQKLAKRMESKAVTLWKCQIITTRTSEKPFPGAKLTANGTYSATVKSKTIYRSSPIDDSAIEELKKALHSVEKGQATVTRALPSGKYCYVYKTDTGHIAFREYTNPPKRE